MKKLFAAMLAMASVSVQAAEPYPADYFALREVVSSVDLSPDGKYLAMRVIPNKDADPVIEVYQTDDLKKEPFRLNADPMEIQGLNWVGDDVFIMSLRQKVRDKIDGFNRGVYEYMLASVDVKRKKMKKFEDIGARFEGVLPDKPKKVLFRKVDYNRKSGGSVLPQFYELDIKTGSKRLIARETIAHRDLSFDKSGRPWYSYGFDEQTAEFVDYIRLPDSKEWIEIHRQHRDNFETFSVVGYDHKKPWLVFVIANNGNDKAGLWEYDVKQKKLTELIYRRKDVDVSGIRVHSNTWTNPDEVVGVAYRKDKTHIEYFDGVEAATYKQLAGLIPNAGLTRIISRSRDGQSLVIYNSAPRDPGSYYLLHKGQLQKVGSRQPLLEAEKLADTKYIEYTARDGRTIPAYITVPNGKGPFPAILLPHGGPFVSETVNYDKWSQMLANNGYLVLQPQYRGSKGRGLEHYLSAFNTAEGGQGGYKMQDDKDDGMKYLVEQGMADPNRLAVFGWSYGGYAALIAAARDKNLYQCTIAGAAVTDNLMQVNYYRDRIKGAGRTEQLRMWDDSISPIKEVAKVNIPLLLIHGSVDQRVPPEHAKRYLKELDKHGKNYKYVELDGADHFSNTLTFDHQKLLFESMLSYLKNDCGPGGL